MNPDLLSALLKSKTTRFNSFAFVVTALLFLASLAPDTPTVQQTQAILAVLGITAEPATIGSGLAVLIAIANFALRFVTSKPLMELANEETEKPELPVV